MELVEEEKVVGQPGLPAGEGQAAQVQERSVGIVAPGMFLAVAETINAGKVRVWFLQFVRQFLKSHFPFPPDKKI